MRKKGVPTTVCASCGREVGVVPNWSRRQQGLLIDTWHVARHTVTGNRDGNRPRGGPICPGSRVLVPPPAALEPPVSKCSAGGGLVSRQ